MAAVRLDRFFSSQGVCTRGEIRRLLRDGRIAVNGHPANSPGLKIDPESDQVTLDGSPVSYAEHVYYMMNKPAGIVSASRDPHARTVLDLLPPGFRRPGLFPAGRLDKDTEGLLLITDDGQLAHDLLSPRHHVDKCYYAELDLPPAPGDAARFRSGLQLPDGLKCLPAVLAPAPDGVAAHVLVTLREGKYHQVKRMFEACGRCVLFLRRVSFGGVVLDRQLAPGAARMLTGEELAALNCPREADCLKD